MLIGRSTREAGERSTPRAGVACPQRPRQPAEWLREDGAALYCQTRPDGGELISEAYTPAGAPAVHNVEDTRAT